MKKFIKISLITAGVLFLVGCLLGVIGLIGAKKQLKQTIVEEVKLGEKIEQLVETVGDMNIDFSGKDLNIQIGSDTPTELKINGEIITEQSSNKTQVDAASVQNLELELGAGTFTVEEKDAADGTIDILFEGLGNCNYYVEENTLHVEGFKGINIGNNGANEIIVRIPQGSQFEEVDAEIGAGVMTMESMKVRDLETSIGAGELEIKRMEVEELASEIGAGRLEISDTVANNVELSVAMGECIFEGTINGNLDADCDMGNLELALTGKEEDHNYEVECAAGNVSIGDFEFAALAADREVDNNVESTFDINCSMGNIVIEFEE